MNRRYVIGLVLTIVGVGVVGAGSWWVWDRRQSVGLSVGCQSDNLSTVAKHLSDYAQQHEGTLPPADDLLAVAQGEHGSYLWCDQMGLPYQWNLRLAGAEVNSPGVRAVAWCPPGGHGRYVGVITIRDNELHVERITISELREILAAQSTDR